VHPAGPTEPDRQPGGTAPRCSPDRISEEVSRARQRSADFVPGRVGAPPEGTSVLNAVSAGSREEVDELLAKARAAGGKPWMPAQDHGFMYGTSFTDPDGNVWETMWMDPSVPQ
jgi:predicted lactoylglutathione lyase